MLALLTNSKVNQMLNQNQIDKIRNKRMNRIESLLSKIDKLQESGMAAKFEISKLEKELCNLDVDLSCKSFETELRSVSLSRDL